MTGAEAGRLEGWPEASGVLLRISRSISGTLDPEELYRTLHRESARVLDAAGFYVTLCDPDEDVAEVAYLVDHGEEQPVDARFCGSESEVIRSGRPLLVRDCRGTLPLVDLGPDDSEPVLSLITVPLLQGERVIGSMSAQSYRPDAYTSEDLVLMQGIADIVAVAVQNARRVEEIRRRRLEAEQIEETVRALSSSLDLEVVLQTIARAAVRSFGVERTSVWVVTEGAARLGASVGDGFPDDEEWELGGAMLETLRRRSDPLLFSEVDPGELPPDVRSTPGSERPAASGMIMGLQSPAGLHGVLVAGSREPRAFVEREIRMMTRLAHHASVALENAHLHASLEALSLTDHLTGLPNRRHLMLHLEREIAAAKRGRPLSAVIFDLDHFKEYNDAHGHLAGDRLLRIVADILSSESRAMNFSGRFGGDEFVSLISDSGSAGAAAHAERICARVAKDPTLASYGVTLSYGLACFSESMETGEDLLDAADTELYRAKGSRGRDENGRPRRQA